MSVFCVVVCRGDARGSKNYIRTLSHTEEQSAAGDNDGNGDEHLDDGSNLILCACVCVFHHQGRTTRLQMDIPLSVPPHALTQPW